jgi:radical SAM protein with 4Fe4S-binding SPASM domain
MFKKIYLEITNNCNLDCSFCVKNKRNKKFIALNDFEEVLSKIKGYTKYLYFHIMGEPLLHPQINELIDMASKDFFVNITTNGYLIKKIEDNDNIRQINISLHSFHEKYKKTLNEYLENIFEVTDKLLSKGTIVKYRMWVDSVNKTEVINKLEEKYGTKIDNDSVKLAHDVYYEVEQEFIWPSMDNNYYSKTGSCRALRDHLGILVDGTIVPCCLDSEGIIKLGNIYKNEINDIINSDLFKEMKQGFLDNKKIHELCRKCNFYELRR